MDGVAPALKRGLGKSAFHISSRVALAIGAAIEYTTDPESTRRNRPAYRNIYDRTVGLVRDLIRAASRGADSFSYCLATSLAIRYEFSLCLRFAAY